MLRITLFGRFRAVAADQSPVRVQRRDTERLWLYLLLNRDLALGRDQVAFQLWTDETEDDARALLRRHLSWLTGALPPAPANCPWLTKERHLVAWNGAAPCWLDVAEFEALRRRAGLLDPIGDAAEAAAMLQAAVALYTDDLATDYQDDWLTPWRQRFRAGALRALGGLGTAAEAAGETETATRAHERYLELDPAHEPAHRALMRLHFLQGDKSAALRQYDACGKALAACAGLHPSNETERLLEAIRAGEPGAAVSLVGLPGVARPSAPDVRPRPHLPAPANSFVGREAIVSDLELRIVESPLTTLTGPGGAGKTRLALEVARRVAGSFADGVAWVDLSDIADGRFIPEQIARAVDCRPGLGEPTLDAVCRHLADRSVLLVLDNCEQIVDDAAAVVIDVLAECDGVRILVTSRERLGIEAETVSPIAGLDLPVRSPHAGVDDIASAEAVRLFVERVRAVWPEFAASREHVLYAAEVCEQVDGIPLCIELAAARVGALSVDEIARRLASDLGTLRARSRSRPSRHQTIEAAIDWSYRLLSAPEQVLLRRLAVFDNGFDLAAVDGVPRLVDSNARADPLADADLIDVVGRLIDKSLVAANVNAPGTHRFRMLRTIRMYCWSQLDGAGERDAVARQHAQYYLGLLHEAGPHLGTPAEGPFVERMSADIDNLRAAMRWVLADGDGELAMSVAAEAWPFWFGRGLFDFERDWLDQALQLPVGGARAARAAALRAAGTLAYGQGDFAAALDYYGAAVAAGEGAGDDAALAAACLNLGLALTVTGRYGAAIDQIERAIAILTELGDVVRIAQFRVFLASALSSQGDYVRARGILEESLAAQRSQGAPDRRLATCLDVLGEVALRQGDFACADVCAHEMMEVVRDSGFRAGVANCTRLMGLIALDRGQTDAAGRLFKEELALWQEIHHRDNVARALNNLGEVEHRAGRLPVARRYFESSLTAKRLLADAHSTAYTLGNLADLACDMDDLASADGYVSETAATAAQLGARDLEAWAGRIRARIAVGEGRPDAAASLVCDCLIAHRWMGALRQIALDLEVGARIEAARQRWPSVVRLLAGASAIRNAIGAPPSRAEEDGRIAAAELARAALGPGDADAIAAHTTTLDVYSIVDMALDELAGGS